MSNTEQLIRDIEQALNRPLAKWVADREKKGNLQQLLDGKIGKLRGELGNSHPTVEEYLKRSKKIAQKVRIATRRETGTFWENIQYRYLLRLPWIEAITHVKASSQRIFMSIIIFLLLLGTMAVILFMRHSILPVRTGVTQVANITPSVTTTPTASTFPGIPVTSTPTGTPTPTPEIIITSITPPLITTETHPREVTLTGERFTAIQEIALLAADGTLEPMNDFYLPESDTRLQLLLDELFQKVDGEVAYTPVVNNVTYDNWRIIIRDFQSSMVVKGVRQEYRNRGEDLFFTYAGEFGAYIWTDATRQSRLMVAGDEYVVVSNGDKLEILQEDPLQDAYRVRVRTNRIDADHPAIVGQVGWIPRWLVDDTTYAPPPALTPTPSPWHFAGNLLNPPVSDGVPCHEPGRSFVEGSVYGAGGATLITGARVQVTSLTTGAVFSNLTNERGNYAIHNLGCGKWRVELISVPHAPAGITSQQELIDLNGGQYNRATIDFIRQP
jgi:hypothetical protein